MPPASRRFSDPPAAQGTPPRSSLILSRPRLPVAHTASPGRVHGQSSSTHQRRLPGLARRRRRGSASCRDAHRSAPDGHPRGSRQAQRARRYHQPARGRRRTRHHPPAAKAGSDQGLTCPAPEPLDGVAAGVGDRCGTVRMARSAVAQGHVHEVESCAAGRGRGDGVGGAAREAAARGHARHGALLRRPDEGTTYGTVVLHVTPEAAAGGPLALVRTGDSVVLDLPARRARRGCARPRSSRLGNRRRPPRRLRRAVTRAGAASTCRPGGQPNTGADLDFLVGSNRGMRCRAGRTDRSGAPGARKGAAEPEGDHSPRGKS